MTDFESWSHKNLAHLAQEFSIENMQLKEDIKVLRNAWRELVKEKYLAGVLAVSQDPRLLSPALLQAPERPDVGLK